MRALSSFVALLIASLLVLVGCRAVEPPPPPPDWLWVTVWGSSKVVAFDPIQVGDGATGTDARLALGLGPTRQPYGLVFDADGNLWVSTQGGEVLMYAAATLAASGTPDPTAELVTGTGHIGTVAFSPDGTLWAAGPDRLMGWRAATLAAGGTPSPDVALTGTAEWTFAYPNDMAFDADGGLWVVGAGVARFGPDQQTTGGALVPEIILTSDGTSLADPRGLAFDADGDLWVASMNGGLVEKLRSENLAVSGSPTPVVALTGLGTYPMRLRFDDHDNLWVSAVYGPSLGPAGYVAMVAPQHRVSSGVAVITTEFTALGSIDAGGAMAFHPGPQFD